MGLRSLLPSFALVLTFVLAGSLADARPSRAVPAPAWAHARIVDRDGDSVFEVNGKPFFLYGAAFFYERLPRDRWAGSLAQLKALGINTLDLYVPWNWHELSDGDFDFSGRTSPRRDFDEVLRLAKTMDFEIVLRPGPVVRNEWRNGGYPAWLLSRPEYGMPLHDLLEGRYPPTATLQNQHSDDAAAQWMRNATHLTYAKRWLERVLHECDPYADRVLAVALDDDQGAYIDNQTYPAPHFAAYLAWLRDVVHGVTGPDELTFINTYQMKVPASSPVWAMGNWYQSDAYSIGTHDESQLAFSFAELATRPHQPLFASEFQAGWLQGAGEAYPRGADPSNTELAIGTMLGTGVRGIVNFPAQDTLNPTGWEAPFANFAYAWSAALTLDESQSQRYEPTVEFGKFVGMYGPELAVAVPRYDASIVYPGTAVDPVTVGPQTFAAIEAATIDAQQACRSAGFACNLVDAGSLTARLQTHRAVFLLPTFDADTLRQIGPRFARIVASLSARAGVTVENVSVSDEVARAMRGRHAIVENGGGTVLSESHSGVLAGFLSVTNYSQLDRTYAHAVVHLSNGRRIVLPRFVVRAHSAFVSPIDAVLARLGPVRNDRPGEESVPPDLRLTFTDCMLYSIGGFKDRATPMLSLSSFGIRKSSCTAYISRATRSGSVRIASGSSTATVRLDDFHASHFVIVEDKKKVTCGSPLMMRPDLALDAACSQSGTTVYSQAPVRPMDVYREGADSLVFDSASAKLVVSPNAGARSFYFAAGSDRRNWFTTVGGLRDDVAIEPPLSTTDRIAKYTHDFPAGTFNRPYVPTIRADRASASFAYVFPDALPHGATIEKTIRSSSSAGFDLDENIRFGDLAPGDPQRGVSVDSFALDPHALATAALYVPAPALIAPGTTRTVDFGNAFAVKRGTECLVVAWRAGDVEATSLQERADSIVARLTFVRDRTAHVIFRQVACAAGTSPLAPVEAEAQLLPQVTPSPGRTP